MQRVARGWTLVASIASASMLWACSNGGGPPPPPKEEGEVKEQIRCDPGPAPIRRLTRREYNNTVRDLLGDSTRPADAFPTEEQSLGFHNNADAQASSPVLVERYLDAAEALSARAITRLDTLLPCDPAKAGEAACARSFIESFGQRAFRRPLEEPDVDAFAAVFEAGRNQGGFATGIEWTIQAFLQSPEFLYRVEVGTPVEGRPGVNALDDWELASRLSYLVWGSMPDQALFDAARAGQLRSPEQLEAQARRLLEDPRAKETIRDFHAQWLWLANIEGVEKDAQAFPEFDPEIRPHLEAEAMAFIDEVVWNGPGDLTSLFTAPYTFLNGPLSRHYGIQNGPTGSALQKFELSPERASGLLTQGGLLSVLAKPNQTSPIVRGKFVREQLLCWHIPPPPDNILLVAPDPDPNLDARERLAIHRNDPSCSGCHRLMDPIGFGFEKFDGTGRFRTAENGRPIDDKGEVLGTEITSFVGIPDLARQLAATPDVHTCVARQWFRYGQGRADLETDACSIESMEQRFTGSGLKITELLVGITQTESFRFRRAISEGGSK